MELTILICTHNRRELLSRVIQSINAATRPNIPVKVLVIANACTDDTSAYLDDYRARYEQACESGAKHTPIPLSWIEEPRPGKSNALNTALRHLDTALIGFVDDDHRVDANYLNAIAASARQHPEVELFCGRILPDWDGSEPTWVHDSGPYRIYPLPVPRYDLGSDEAEVTSRAGPIPGGGNLVVRREVFDLVGQFSTDLGPRGHDLSGGEDSDYVLRAMHLGVICRYIPAIAQYHFVDTERLRFSYLLRKSFQRTRSNARIGGSGPIPFYMWRKLLVYGVQAIFSLSWPRTRFYCVRFAAALGEISGRAQQNCPSALRPHAPLENTRYRVLLLIGIGLMFTAFNLGGEFLGAIPRICAQLSLLGSVTLLVASLTAFSRTGPPVRAEILSQYREYMALALLRLVAWAFVIMLVLSTFGALVYQSVAMLLDLPHGKAATAIAGTAGILGCTALQFVRLLRVNPGLIVASLHYRLSRLASIWRAATVDRLRSLTYVGLGVLTVLLLAASAVWFARDKFADLAALWAYTLGLAALAQATRWPETPVPAAPLSPPAATPNVLLIGSDTLRADRLGTLGYHRALTPAIDALAMRSTVFANCHVPCARTAPSLLSLFTGTWPHTHGIRDNFGLDGVPIRIYLRKPKNPFE